MTNNKDTEGAAHKHRPQKIFMGVFITLYSIKALVFAFNASKKLGLVCALVDVFMIAMVCKMAGTHHVFADFASAMVKVVMIGLLVNAILVGFIATDEVDYQVSLGWSQDLAYKPNSFARQSICFNMIMMVLTVFVADVATNYS